MIVCVDILKAWPVSVNLVTFLSVTDHLFASAVYSTNAHGNKIVGRFAYK